MRGKNHRGQFYLVAGIIIVSVIIGFIAISNYVGKSQTMIVNDLKKELLIETQKVIDYDVSHAGETMREYGINYSSHLGSSIEVYFIIGSDPINAYQYINGVETPIDDLPEGDLLIDGANDKIILTLNNINYEFALMSGENFYFLISQEIKGESFVATG